MSNKSERAILDSMGAKPHPNSGRGYIKKGDGTWGNFIVDVKEASRSFTLNMKVWQKVCTDTIRTDPSKDPALVVVLEGKHKLAIVPLDVLEDLIDRAN